MKHLIIALKGLFVGGTMLVPGVSGGSMAMILGIYHELIASISSFLKHKKESLLFLGVFVAGALVGMALFARPLEALIERFPMPTLYFFIGAVVGGVPLMVKESGITSFSLKRVDSWKDIGFALVGLVIVAAFEFIPAESWGAGALTGNAPFYLLLIAGLVASVALVLPGISVSYILLVMGLYEELTRSLTDFNFAFLAPLALGLVAGILLTTRILERAMDNHPRATYMIILGFVLGSLFEVFPGVPQGWELLISLVTFALGFAAVYALSWQETHAKQA